MRAAAGKRPGPGRHDHPEQHPAHRRARRRRVARPRNEQRGLVERPDQDVREGTGGLRRNPAASIAASSTRSDQPEPVAEPDLPPRLPTEHGGRLDQRDPLDLGLGARVEEGVEARRQHIERIRGAAAATCAPIRSASSCSTCSYNGEEQRGLVPELVVERTARDSGAAAISGVPTAPYPALREQPAGRADRGGARGRGALDLRPACLSCSLSVSYVQNVRKTY